MSASKQYIWLDFIRGVSALLVCAGHIRSAVFVDYVDVVSPSFVDKVFYFVTGLGHQAVMAFFVLSGFFVGGSIVSKSTGFNWKQYLIARLSRLWSVLLPALIFTLIVSLILKSGYQDVLDGKYRELWLSGPSSSSPAVYNVKTFFGNMFFLQTIYVPVFSINGPLWSLSNEFWYYLMFPAIYLASINLIKFDLNGFLKNILVLGLIVLIVPVGFYLGFVVWLMGVLSFVVFASKLQKFKLQMVILGVLYTCFALMVSKFNVMSPAISDLNIGIGIAILCIGVGSYSATSTGIKLFDRLIIGLSRMSYTLYLFHVPIVIYLASTQYGAAQMKPSILSYDSYAVWLIVLLVIAYIFWFVFERNTPQLKAAINKLLVRS
ncbi:MAG: acyltransferase family protein [bacterium]